MARPDRPGRLQVVLKCYSPECVEYKFSEVRLTSILGSSVIVASFATVGAEAQVGRGERRWRYEALRQGPLRSAGNVCYV
jgi:hypothetical protein